MSYTFNIHWETTIVIDDAVNEDEAWDRIADAIDHAWSKSHGSKTIELVEDYDEENWLWDDDPESKDWDND